MVVQCDAKDCGGAHHVGKVRPKVNDLSASILHQAKRPRATRLHGEMFFVAVFIEKITAPKTKQLEEVEKDRRGGKEKGVVANLPPGNHSDHKMGSFN